MLPGKFSVVRKVFQKHATYNFKFRKSFQKKSLQSKILNIFGQSGRFPESLEDFQTVWKIFRQSTRFPDGLENALDSLENFQAVWKIPDESGRFSDSLEHFRQVRRFPEIWKD